MKKSILFLTLLFTQITFAQGYYQELATNPVDDLLRLVPEGYSKAHVPTSPHVKCVVNVVNNPGKGQTHILVKNAYTSVEVVVNREVRKTHVTYSHFKDFRGVVYELNSHQSLSSSTNLSSQLRVTVSPNTNQTELFLRELKFGNNKNWDKKEIKCVLE